MNPKPFSLLNHLTVPCSATAASCCVPRVARCSSASAARSLARPFDALNPFAARGGREFTAHSTPSPVRLEGASVVVLQAERVVLGRVAVGDFEHAPTSVTTVGDAVRRLCRDDELLAGRRLDDLVSDLNGQSRVEHDPHLVAHLMVVNARLLSGFDRDHTHGARLVERVGDDLAPRLVDDHPPASFGNCSSTDAVSMAAIAASHPLFPCFPPERSIACSNVSVVRTPKMTGTPVSSAAARMPFAACPATCSKCAVSPRITAPRQITASYPDAAARRAAIGSSKAPGTHATTRSSSTTPCARRHSIAPASSLPVTISLNLETTSANRRPRARNSPRISLTLPPRRPGPRARR